MNIKRQIPSTQEPLSFTGPRFKLFYYKGFDRIGSENPIPQWLMKTQNLKPKVTGVPALVIGILLGLCLGYFKPVITPMLGLPGIIFHAGCIISALIAFLLSVRFAFQMFMTASRLASDIQDGRLDLLFVSGISDRELFQATIVPMALNALRNVAAASWFIAGIIIGLSLFNVLDPFMLAFNIAIMLEFFAIGVSFIMYGQIAVYAFSMWSVRSVTFRILLLAACILPQLLNVIVSLNVMQGLHGVFFAPSFAFFCNILLWALCMEIEGDRWVALARRMGRWGVQGLDSWQFKLGIFRGDI